jgi:hypothetical protein
MGAKVSELSTKLMEEPTNIANFMSFLQARGVANTTVEKHITQIRKVLVWRSSLGVPAAQHTHLQEVIGWVDILHSQSAYIGQPSRAREHNASLPQAKEVLKWQLKVTCWRSTLPSGARCGGILPQRHAKIQPWLAWRLASCPP